MIFFRADSNSQIASGHVMRCISIASFFRERGKDVMFLIADENPIKLLEPYAIPYKVLHTDWNDLSTEVSVVRDTLSAYPSSLLLVDTYRITEDYVNALTDYATICYLGSKPDYLGRLKAIINYSSVIDEERYRILYPHTRLLLGTQYAPLRKEFRDIPMRLKSDTQHILITTGNTDATNIVGCILETLERVENSKDVTLDVVVGGSFAHADNLYKQFGNIQHIILHRAPVNMSELMRKADLSITANGTTVYELIASKVPVISFAMVAEQIESAIGLSKKHCLEYCGYIGDDASNVLEQIKQRVIKLSPLEARRELVKQASQFIDGNGCERIYNEIMEIYER